MMNVEKLMQMLEDYPRAHISIHGVDRIEEAIERVSWITDKNPEVSSGNDAYWVMGRLGDGGGTITVFVSK
jgi:hypothetical protein